MTDLKSHPLDPYGYLYRVKISQFDPITKETLDLIKARFITFSFKRGLIQDEVTWTLEKASFVVGPLMNSGSVSEREWIKSFKGNILVLNEDTGMTALIENCVFNTLELHIRNTDRSTYITVYKASGVGQVKS